MEFSKRLDLFGDEIFAALNERKVALEAQGRTISERRHTGLCACRAHPQGHDGRSRRPAELEVQPARPA